MLRDFRPINVIAAVALLTITVSLASAQDSKFTYLSCSGQSIITYMDYSVPRKKIETVRREHWIFAVDPSRRVFQYYDKKGRVFLDISDSAVYVLGQDSVEFSSTEINLVCKERCKREGGGMITIDRRTLKMKGGYGKGEENIDFEGACEVTIAPPIGLDPSNKI